MVAWFSRNPALTLLSSSSRAFNGWVVSLKVLLSRQTVCSTSQCKIFPRAGSPIRESAKAAVSPTAIPAQNKVHPLGRCKLLSGDGRCRVKLHEQSAHCWLCTCTWLGLYALDELGPVQQGRILKLSSKSLAELQNFGQRGPHTYQAVEKQALWGSYCWQHKIEVDSWYLEPYVSKNWM